MTYPRAIGHPEKVRRESARGDARRAVLDLLQPEVPRRSLCFDYGRGQGWHESKVLLRIENEEILHPSRSQVG
jgi:hypothetical protein